MDDNLLAYLLDELDESARAEVEQTITADVNLRRRLAALQSLLSPLQTDRIEITTPTGLIARTVSLVAEHIVTHGCAAPAASPQPRARQFKAPTAPTEPVAEAETELQVAAPLPTPIPADPSPAALPVAPRERTRTAAVPGWYRWDVLAVCALSACLVALGVPALLKLRYMSQRVACKENLHQLFNACSLYADAQNEQFPAIASDPPNNCAGAVIKMLADAQLLPKSMPACTADSLTTAHQTNFAYHLGFRAADGGLVGLNRRPNDDLPGYRRLVLAGDRSFPNPEGGLRTDGEILSAHGNSANVLYVDGQVEFVNKPFVGVKRDNIYLNRESKMRAGLTWDDTVLGDPDAQP
jgi:prepilin-type processing-associated H-X9-DG protein